MGQQKHKVRYWASFVAVFAFALSFAITPAISHAQEKAEENEGEKVPEELKKSFGEELVNREGEKISVEQLADKERIGVYFGALWCPPCRQFSPKLVEFYNKLQEKGQSFEIVFVSHDRGKEKMEKYMEEEEMPWLAIPFEDKQRRKELSRDFGVRGIPTLVILDGEGNTISKNARGAVARDGVEAYEQW